MCTVTSLSVVICFDPRMMPLNDASRECTPTPLGRPDSCAIGYRLLKNTSPLPQKLSDYQLPTTPGNRLLSSRMANRRNVTLKPIDRPKTPALIPIDDGIRGFKLHTNLSHNSPPSTPLVRKDQLPPLDSVSSTMGCSSVIINISDRSPPTQLRTSAHKNRVMFNSRIVSAADVARYSRTSSDPRPSSTTTAFRHGPTTDSSSRLPARKGSDHLLNHRMKMSGVGRGVKHAASGGGVGATGVQHGIGEMGYRDRATNSIAEDDEASDGKSASFAVTGTSGFFRKGMRTM